MRRYTRQQTKRTVAPVPLSDEEESKKKKFENVKQNKNSTKPANAANNKINHDSSSESDIEDYLQPADKIDLNSSFFQVISPTNKVDPSNSFKDIEERILENVNNVSESQLEEVPSNVGNKINFQHLHDYTNKLEETKQHLKAYESQLKGRKCSKTNNENEEKTILNMLAEGESKTDTLSDKSLQQSIGYYSCSESEVEDWEEVTNQADEERVNIPKEGVQITLDLPNGVKKKKTVDLMAILKRKLNRVKKETQLLMHKVHLLCWIAHGNYVNSVLNDPKLLAVALSLIPSQHCYPSDRMDLNYLQQIVEWYSKMITILHEPPPNDMNLAQVLLLQINKKEVYDEKMLVCIFICILRSLGIQCRLALSFQAIPIRPDSSELCSLSTKPKETEKGKPKTPKNKDSKAMNAATKEIVNKTVKQKNTTQKKAEPNTKGKDSKRVIASSSKSDQTKSKIDGKTVKSKNGKRDEKEKVDIKPEKKLTRKEIKEIFAKPVEPKMKALKPKESSSSSSNDKSSKKKPSKTISKSTKKSKGKLISQVDGADNTSDSSEDETEKDRPRRRLKTRNYSEITSENEDFDPDSSDSGKDFLKEFSEDSDSQDEFVEKSISKRPNLKRLGSFSSQSKSSKSESDSSPKLKKSLPNIKKLIDKASTSKEKPKNIDEFIKSKQLDVRNDVIDIVTKRMKQEKEISDSKLVKKRKSRQKVEGDEDYVYEKSHKKQIDSEDEFHKKNTVPVKKRIGVKKGEDGKLSVVDSKAKKGIDVWVEIFLEAEEKWICADLIKAKIHCVSEIHARASRPVCYVVVWNNDNSLKDVTKRYCKQWATVTRKLRCDDKWWQDTLRPFSKPKNARDFEEDEDLARLQLDQPLPQTISEYKDHPLYVLKRHLLKFQAIYPPDVAPVGFVRKEAVYPRSCVYVLHSRDIWLKSAKVVKLGEKPYKIVKARPKYDKLSGKVVTDQLLEIFGLWQVTDYEPPVAENGVVPRNAYGNVDLFKQCMLPKGTVQLQLAGLNKVAKKLGIDCAPAVVGFDFHSGWSHPTFDGFVVCEEFEDILIAAWNEEQEEAEKREQEKIDKRVYGNWRRLIKGLLIRERLKKKYDFQSPSKGDKRPKGSKGGSKKICP